jgi:hypothetical protein
MGYVYAEHRPYVFTEEGQITFLKIRDHARKLIDESGAASCEKIINVASGDMWSLLACVDRLVELKELWEVPNPFSSAGQHRLFIGVG